MKKTFRKKAVASFFIIALLIGGCHKKNDVIPDANNGMPPANTKLKTSNNGNSNFEYDNAGRATKVTNNGNNEYTFVYTADSVIQKRYLANGATMETYHMKLNANGLVENYVNDVYPAISIKYEYNADNTMRKKINYTNGILDNTTVYTYIGGNLAADSTFSPSGASWSGRKYQYYVDKFSTIENTNRGIVFWGTGNKNALKKITYLTNCIVQTTQDFLVPETDALNRLTKTSYQTNGTGTAFSNTYTYY